MTDIRKYITIVEKTLMENIHIIDYDDEHGGIEGYVVNTDQEQLQNFLSNESASSNTISQLRNKYSKIAIIKNIWVDDDHQGTGIGSSLLEYAIDEANSSGANAIILVAQADDPKNQNRLIKWYESYGFSTIEKTSSGNIMVLDLTNDTKIYENLDQPVYDHDCDACIFVGHDQSQAGEPHVNMVDMYVHRRPSGYTLIRRYGSEPSNYSSVDYAHTISPKYINVVNAAKAKEIFENNQSLKEIEIVSPQTFDKNYVKSLFVYSIFLDAEISGYPLYKVDHQNQRIIMAWDKDTQEPVAFVGFEHQPHIRTSLWISKNAESFVKGKALSAKIIRYCKQILKMTIQSDMEQSVKAKKLWTSTLPKLGLTPHIHDTKTHRVLSQGQIDPYKDDNHRYCWILEHNDTYRNMLPENSLLQPFNNYYLNYQNKIKNNVESKQSSIILNEYEDRDKLLEKYKDDPNIYISFTEVAKIGVNPRYQYDTPVGIYCYPLKAMWDTNTNKLSSIPFGHKRPYIQVLRAKNMMELGEYTENNLSTDIQKLNKNFGDIVTHPITKEEEHELEGDYDSYVDGVVAVLPRSWQHSTPNTWKKISLAFPKLLKFHEWIDLLYREEKLFYKMVGIWKKEAKLPNNPASQLWNITRHIAEYEVLAQPEKYRYHQKNAPLGSFREPKRAANPAAVMWNKILRSLGYTGISDNTGLEIIHSNEPKQAVFLTAAGYDHLETIHNIEKQNWDYNQYLVKHNID